MCVLIVQGPGMIVSHEKKDIIRSHHDLDKDTCRYTKKAAKVKECGEFNGVYRPLIFCHSSMKAWLRGQLKMDMLLISTVVLLIKLDSMK